MALIKCPECGREISSSAESCIHCGCPISGGQQDFKIHEEEAKRYQVNEKKSKRKKTAAIVIPIVLGVLAFIGRSEENRLRQESAQEQVPTEPAIERQAEGESSKAQEDEVADTDISTPDFTDALILLDRFLIDSDSAVDQYVTVYYGKDSNTVKELLYEWFILKNAVSGTIDPENYDLSDFTGLSEGFGPPSDESIRDIGNYYLLTLDYTDLDDADEVSTLVYSGMLEWQGEGEQHEGLIDASYYMDSLKKSGYEQGYFADKEYASFFGSGRKDAQ